MRTQEHAQVVVTGVVKGALSLATLIFDRHRLLRRNHERDTDCCARCEYYLSRFQGRCGAVPICASRAATTYSFE